jgi:hypothetical protein
MCIHICTQTLTYTNTYTHSHSPRTRAHTGNIPVHAHTPALTGMCTCGVPELGSTSCFENEECLLRSDSQATCLLVFTHTYIYMYTTD